MRFKAKLAPEHVALLSNLIGPISKLAPSSASASASAPSARTGGGAGGDSDVHGTGSILLGGGGTVVHLDPDHVRISTRGGSSGKSSSNDDGGGGYGGHGGGAEGMACFAELRTQGGIFLEHRIESAADDVIVFEIDLGQLRVALQSVLSALGRGGFGVGKMGGGSGSGGAGNANPLHNSMAAGRSTTSGSGSNNVMNTTSTTSTNTAMAASLTPTIVVMKLAKRNGGLPCLCIDANSLPGGRGGGGGSVEVHHAIPVRVMRAVEMQYHLPPRISMPQVQVELPFDRPLRTVVDRLKTMSPHIYIEGSMDGELTLRIDGDGASIRTFYGKLIPRFEDLEEDDESSGDDESKDDGHETDGTPSSARKRRRKTKKTKTCTLKVDSRKLSACLQWQGTMLLGRSVGSAVLCMVKNEMLCLHCMLNPGTVGFFTYYVPVHYLSPDQMDF